MKTHLNSLALALLAISLASAQEGRKVSERTSLSSGDLAPATDILPIVDVSAGTEGSKKITINDLFVGWGITAAGSTLAKAADASAQRTALSLVPGTDVQAWDSDLDSWAAKTAPAGAVVGTSDTQTLSGKTLTSPVINVSSDATGDLYYRSSGGAFSRLGIGSTGQVLTVASGLPSWAAAGGGGGGGLTNFTEAVSSSAPNAAVPAASFTATNAATNVDFVIRAKGSGSILAAIPDNTATGGNKRGSGAVDLQTGRTSNTQVASGDTSFSVGRANRSSGSYSITAGRENVASGTQAIAIGYQSTASNDNATAIGYYNTSSGQQSTAIGYANNASGIYGVAIGCNNTSDSTWSFASGANSVTRGVPGAMVHANGTFASNGDAQAGKYLLRNVTNNATQSLLWANGTSASARLTLPNSSTFAFSAIVTARQSTGDSAAFEVSGCIKRGASAGTTALVGTPAITSLGADTGAATWSVAVGADTTAGALSILVTGEAGKTIRWLATVETTEVVY